MCRWFRIGIIGANVNIFVAQLVNYRFDLLFGLEAAMVTSYCYFHIIDPTTFSDILYQYAIYYVYRCKIRLCHKFLLTL